ncbi:hypothetical protein GQ600_23839 [Phytophthora cactorum]|nr:hypothetical protein GQ600_23839 [Phytophthora cactorum]
MFNYMMFYTNANMFFTFSFCPGSLVATGPSGRGIPVFDFMAVNEKPKTEGHLRVLQKQQSGLQQTNTLWSGECWRNASPPLLFSSASFPSRFEKTTRQAPFSTQSFGERSSAEVFCRHALQVNKL